MEKSSKRVDQESLKKSIQEKKNLKGKVVLK